MSQLLRTLSQSEGSDMALERLRWQEADIEATITRLDFVRVYSGTCLPLTRAVIS